MWKGALSRLVYITAYSSISFFLPLPNLYLFYHRSLYYYHLLFLSNYPAILSPLSSRVSLYALSSPYTPIHALFHSVIFSFPFTTLSPPYSPASRSYDLPLGRKRKRKIVGLVVNYTNKRIVDETLAASRRHLKCSCVNRSATFTEGRILRRASASLSIIENSSSLISCSSFEATEWNSSIGRVRAMTDFFPSFPHVNFENDVADCLAHSESPFLTDLNDLKFRLWYDRYIELL